MAVLQALLALISKSAGKVLNAIFGWAVHALFGRTSSREQTLLSGLVAAAVAWPILVLGLIAPKVVALLLAFVPIPHWVPSWIVRLVWLVLALTVPFALGAAVTARAPAGGPPESAIKRLARGFPITVGLAAAFLIMFVSVPVMRAVALIRGQKSADVPLLSRGDSYHRVAAAMVDRLNQHGFALRPAEPGWWISAPTRILGWFGGKAFRGFVPERPEHYEAPGLSVSFYSSAALLSGSGSRVTWAHGLMEELAAQCDAFQTVSSKAQRLETEIRRVWEVYRNDPAAHERAPRLLARVDEITRELGKLDVEFDEWQAIYRQVLQLDRALRGRPQLLELVKEKTPMALNEKQGEAKNDPAGTATGAIPATSMATDPPSRTPTTPHAPFPRLATPSRLAAVLPGASDPTVASDLSTPQLLGEITSQVGLLMKKQLELAKTELRADLKSEGAMAKGLGLAALAGLLSVNLLLVTIVLVLATVMPAWAAGLAVTGVTLAIGVCVGLLGWGRRVRVPLERTRRTLTDDARWTKERLA